jgi:PAS domain S-box-containing protein
MSVAKLPLTGKERTFPENEFIVSKTDRKGIITYGNDVFVNISGYVESELMGAPHNLVRHPRMPRCVFKLLWDTIEAGREIFAYVLNRAKNGDHYWVNAHVTPWFDPSGRIAGYHSNRRVVNRTVLTQVIEPTYARLLDEEGRHASPKGGMAAATAMLVATIGQAGFSGYDEFFHSLGK